MTDYKVSSQGNWGSMYSDNNKKNDENEINNNADIVERQKKNMENSNNVNF